MDDKSKQMGELWQAFEKSLTSYTQTPGSDTDFPLLVEELLANLTHAMDSISLNNNPSPADLYDIKAGLYGAAKVLDVTWEKRLPTAEEEQQERADLGKRFIELARKRIIDA